MSLFNNSILSILGRESSLKVDFIICGTQKGGTTALDHYLRLHPNICMADKKEVHFFDRDDHFNELYPDYSKYHKYFSPKNDHCIIGEATPIYMYWDKAIERIHRYNPKIKLIAVLRNPINRAFSHWNMERDRNREHRSFWDAICEENSILKSPKNKQDRTFSYLDRGFYSSQIRNIYDYFEKDQLLILRNEILRHSPNHALSEVASFLSLPSFDNIEHMEVHSRIYPVQLDKKELSFLKSFYEDEINSLEDILGWDLESWRE